MRKDKSLNSLSLYQRGALAELKLIRDDLLADIRRRGAVLADGTINPAVEAHRKNVHEQLYSLSVYAEVNRAHASEPFDLVRALSDAQVAEADAGNQAADPARDSKLPDEHAD